VSLTAGTGPVLVLRAIGLGDALTGVPALRGLRRLVAPRPVLLAAPAHLGRWLTGLDVVDGCVPTADLDAAPPGRGLGDHDAVDLHGNGPPSRELLARAHPRSLLAFASPGGPGVPWRAGEHEVLRWCRLVASVGAVCGPHDLRLRARPAVAPDGPVVVHPGAASGSRRWPAERWAQVVAQLLRQGREVVLTGGPHEVDLCRRVARAAGGGDCTAGDLDLPALTALVARARLLLCGDTGVAHLATALATPSVLLFGPVAPSAWGPAVDPDLHVVLWHGDGTGDPHGAEPDPHLLRITVEEVLDAAAWLSGADGLQRAEPRDGAAQAVVPPDLRLPAEDLAREGGVGTADAGVVDGTVDVHHR
jgi:hypothetical protein